MSATEKEPPRCHSAEEVAQMLGISRARVWQLETRAIQKLVARLRRDPQMRQAFRDLSGQEPE